MSATVDLFECIGLGVMTVSTSEKEAVSLWRAQCIAEGLDTTGVEPIVHPVKRLKP
jgi:hypothetical protein